MAEPHLGCIGKDAHQHQNLHVIRPVALGVAQGAGKIAMIPRYACAVTL